MPYLETPLKLDEIPMGESRCVQLGDAQVGIFHLQDGLFAIDNICPHHGAPLHDGMIADGVVTCPWHQWQFQLEDGVCTNIPNITVATYQVEVRNGIIWIDFDSKEAPKS